MHIVRLEIPGDVNLILQREPMINVSVSLEQFGCAVVLELEAEMNLWLIDAVPKMVTPNPNVWKRSSTSSAAGVINDEVVQTHLWLMPCIFDLFRYAQIIAKQLKSNTLADSEDDSTCATLNGMRLAFFNLVIASIGRMSWLLSRPESVARCALEKLWLQGSQTLLLVKKYDKGPLAFADEYLSSNEVAFHMHTPPPKHKTFLHSTLLLELF